MRHLLIGLLLTVSAYAGAQPATLAKVAYVVDADTNVVLLDKNSNQVRPIASITKLMNALVIVESGLDLSEPVTITKEDVVRTFLRGRPTSNGLRQGMTLTRGELLQLSLMNSHNVAAYALGRSYPGGIDAFIGAMNAKAELLMMQDTHFTDPTGLHNTNISTATDLVKLMTAAYNHEIVRHYSTAASYQLSQKRSFSTTNRLVKLPDWNIVLQKTGFIRDAGRRVAMMAEIGARRVMIVLLNAPSATTRVKDATQLKHWIEQQPHAVPSFELTSVSN